MMSASMDSARTRNAEGRAENKATDIKTEKAGNGGVGPGAEGGKEQGTGGRKGGTEGGKSGVEGGKSGIEEGKGGAKGRVDGKVGIERGRALGGDGGKPPLINAVKGVLLNLTTISIRITLQIKCRTTVQT